MLKLIQLISFLLLTHFLFGQEIVQEGAYSFKSLKKNCYLGDVSVNLDDQQTSLKYVQNLMGTTTFYTYHFDDNLKFVKEEQEQYNLDQKVKDIAAEVKNTFDWFTNKYKGETYNVDRLVVYSKMKGKIGIQKYRYTYVYGWDEGSYYPEVEQLEGIELKGAKAQKLHLYDWVQNSETGEALLLVGIKAAKGSKIKGQHNRKFQIIKINSDFEAEYLQTISFKYNMAISFMQVLTNELPEEQPAEELDNYPIGDIAQGKLAVVFAPSKNLIAKKSNSSDPSRQALVLINPDGSIDAKIRYKAPASGWAIENFLLSADEKDIYLFGPAQEEAYFNKLDYDKKWKSFQLMKISNNEKVWIRQTDLKQFKEKIVTPPSQKKSPYYQGKKFARTANFITPDGQIFIAGQNYTTKKEEGEEGEGTRKVIDAYKDLVLFHFDENGRLKSQYGVRRDKMNQEAKSVQTPQDLFVSADGQSLYWIYGEIKGYRGGFSLTNFVDANLGMVSKGKLLYYPAVAKINLQKGTIGDFVMVGQDKAGKQRYFMHPNCSYVLSSDNTSLTFVGEDKTGKKIWLGRMPLE